PWAPSCSSGSTSRSSRTRSTGPSSSAPSSSCFSSSFPEGSRAPPLASGAGSRGGRRVLEVRELRKSFDGFQAVGGVSFSVPRGSVSAIIGPNGAGKTTLFNLITGHLRPDAGSVSFKGREVTGIAPHDLCRLGMGRSFQRTNIFPQLTVYENVQAAYVSHRGRGWSLRSEEHTSELQSRFDLVC